MGITTILTEIIERMERVEKKVVKWRRDSTTWKILVLQLENNAENSARTVELAKLGKVCLSYFIFPFYKIVHAIEYIYLRM